MPNCEETLNSIKIKTDTLENIDTKPILDAISFLKDTPLTLIYTKLSKYVTDTQVTLIPLLIELVSTSSSYSNKSLTILRRLEEKYNEDNLFSLKSDITKILNAVFQSGDNAKTIFDYLSSSHASHLSHTKELGLLDKSIQTLQTSLDTSSKTNDAGLNNIYSATQSIYASQSSQNELITNLTTKVNALKNTNTTKIETLISQIHNTDLTDVEAKLTQNSNDIKDFKELYEEHDRVELWNIIQNILGSVYSSNDDAFSVLDYLNINHTLQAQHTIKLEQLQKSAENIYEQLNTTFQNTEAIHLQNTQLNTKVTSMESTIKKMETKINNLQNFNSTSLETKMDKILTFLGQEI